MAADFAENISSMALYGYSGPVVMFPRPRASWPSTRSGGRVPIGQRAPVAGADAHEIQKGTRGSNGFAGASSPAPLGTAGAGVGRLFALRATGQQADNACSEWIAGTMVSAAHNRSTFPASVAAGHSRLHFCDRTAPWMSAAAKAQTFSDQEFSPASETMPPAEIRPRSSGKSLTHDTRLRGASRIVLGAAGLLWRRDAALSEMIL